jgi:hypothetical protein
MACQSSVKPFIVWIFILTGLHCTVSWSAAESDRQAGQMDPVVEKIEPEKSHGHGYRLVYDVQMPIAAYWKFKTDFNNTFLIRNKYIRDHRFISQNGLIAITENKYSYGPDVYFRWQTTLAPEQFRLNFVLLNPEACQQKYHYGTIALDPVDGGTRVTQVAYFDFWGASFWAHYPWKGGMKDFLSYTARWEQETVLQLKDHYDETTDFKQ